MGAMGASPWLCPLGAKKRQTYRRTITQRHAIPAAAAFGYFSGAPRAASARLKKPRVGKIFIPLLKSNNRENAICL
ncbi:MAG: hypothetical protein J6J65_02585 [Opitutales bacterium]|nr:hypothetical protein [Opitutales bacterium]